MSEKLFTSYQLTPQVTLGHRAVFAPCTRSRAMPKSYIPVNPMMAIYYEQRASSAGTLIITEATCISEQGRGYAGTPGIYTKEQIEAWSEITKRIHDKKSFVFMQLWHVGRCSLAEFQPDGNLPVTSTGGPPITSPVFGTKGFETASPSRTLTLEEIEQVKRDYIQAAKNAIEAGCDGVEIHCANGYLMDQFLHNGVNKRDDKYGGPIENRARLHFEVIDSVIDAIGRDRVAVRLSPHNTIYNITDTNYESLYEYLLPELSKRKLAYLHFNEAISIAFTTGFMPGGMCKKYRRLYEGTLISCGEHERDTAIATVDQGDADLIAFGRKFMANPDLQKRLELNAPLNVPDVTTFFGGNEVGYTDYPFLEEGSTTWLQNKWRGLLAYLLAFYLRWRYW